MWETACALTCIFASSFSIFVMGLGLFLMKEAGIPDFFMIPFTLGWFVLTLRFVWGWLYWRLIRGR